MEGTTAKRAVAAVSGADDLTEWCTAALAGELDGAVVTGVAMAERPAQHAGDLDALQLGTVGGVPTMARHARTAGGDPHTFAVGPVQIDIVEPFQTVRLHVDDVPEAPVALDLTFTARTAAHGLRRGTMRAGQEVIWDQSHMIQSGVYDGTFTHEGRRHQVDGWWGQRDHSWGIRDHARCPFWMWLAIQLPDGMLGVWHWELPSGARIYTDGCFAPADGGEPIPVDDGRRGTGIYELTGAHHHRYFPIPRADHLPPDG